MPRSHMLTKYSAPTGSGLTPGPYRVRSVTYVLVWIPTRPIRATAGVVMTTAKDQDIQDRVTTWSARACMADRAGPSRTRASVDLAFAAWLTASFMALGMATSFLRICWIARQLSLVRLGRASSVR